MIQEVVEQSAPPGSVPSERCRGSTLAQRRRAARRILAREGGPLSLAAQILRRLWSARALDRQHHAFRVGNYWVTGPIMDPKAEVMLIELAEARLQSQHCNFNSRSTRAPRNHFCYNSLTIPI